MVAEFEYISDNNTVCCAHVDELLPTRSTYLILVPLQHFFSLVTQGAWALHKDVSIFTPSVPDVYIYLRIS